MEMGGVNGPITDAEVRATPAFRLHQLIRPDRAREDPVFPVSVARLHRAFRELPNVQCPYDTSGNARTFNRYTSTPEYARTHDARPPLRVFSLEAQCGLRQRYCGPHEYEDCAPLDHMELRPAPSAVPQSDSNFFHLAGALTFDLAALRNRDGN